MRSALTAGAVVALLVPFALAGCNGKPAEGRKKITICLLPKKKGSPYFTSCYQGAKKAAEQLGNVELIYDGPTDGSAAKAADMVDRWTQRRVDVIAVSASDPSVLARAMTKARQKGVRVITWDADVEAKARELFVNQATAEEIGNALVEAMVEDIGGDRVEGEVAIISADSTAANQNEWMKHMRRRLKKYPKLTLVAQRFPGEKQQLAQQNATDLINAHPKLKGIFGISSISFPAAAEAVKQAGKTGEIFVTGLSTPNVMRKYVKAGVVKSVVLWNTQDLGYLTIRVGEALARGKLGRGAKTFQAGDLGEKEIKGDNVLLGKILVFDKDNIDEFDF